jgi:cytochrome P450
MEMAAATPTSAPIPDHVPPELVQEIPWRRGATTTGLPHDSFQRLNGGPEKFPEIFYAPTTPHGYGAWVFRRAEHCRQITFDTEHFTNATATPFPRMTGGDWKMIPIEIDPPLHTRYRSILNPLLSPKAMAALDEKVVKYAREYVSAFKDRGSCEFLKEFAFEFPIRIFLELMGLPLEKTAQFLQWERGLLYASTMEEAQASVQAVVNYLNAEIAARRDAPRDDFIGHVLRAEIDGRKLDDKELLGICFTLYVGGLDTVSAHLSLMIRHLAEHPDHQAYLRANRDKIPAAVEEMMRAYGSAGGMRTCVKETRIGEVTIKPGDRALYFAGLAGRDPIEYPEPQDIRFDRSPRHVSFGYGPHVCVGIHLARREMRIALQTMLEMLPSFRIAPGAEIVSELFGMMQPRSLPLVWDQKS